MSQDEYDTNVVLAYQGEVTGHLVFSALAEAEADPGVREVWSKVAAMEALTRDRLEPLARARQASLEETVSKARKLARERAATMTAQSWREIAENYLPRTQGFVERFEQLAALAPLADREVMQQVIDHSRAFGECIRRCLDGDTRGAVRTLDAYLQGG